MKPCTKCGQLHPPKLPCHLANASQDATIVNNEDSAQQTIQSFNEPEGTETLQGLGPPAEKTLLQPEEENAQTLFQLEERAKPAPRAVSPAKSQAKPQAKAYQVPSKGSAKPPPQATPAPQAPKPELAPGFEVDGYVLEEYLGHGGMGEVWRAVQPTIKRKVAVKVLDARLATDRSLVARFLREAQTANEIHHRNLVDIYGFGQIPGVARPYLVMEYLEGRTLGQYLQERGPMPLFEILPLLEQICEAMGAAHQHGVIHRDLKPDNIFLTGQKADRFFVKVLDFGVAKALHAEEQFTQTGDIFGTPEYMAPEQCMGAKEVDHRADLYSLGIVLFEMICGRTPFAEAGDKRSQIWMKHVSQDPPSVTSFMNGRALPPGIDQMLQRALAKEPEARHQTAADLFEAFRAVAHNANQASAPKSPAARPKEAAPKQPAKRKDSDPPKAAFLAPGQAPPDIDIEALKAAKQKHQSKSYDVKPAAPAPAPTPAPIAIPNTEHASETLLPSPKQGVPVFYLGLGIGTALAVFFLMFKLFAGGSSPNEPATLAPKQSALVPAVANSVATSLSTQPIVQEGKPLTDPRDLNNKVKQVKPQDAKALEPLPLKEDNPKINAKEDTLNPFKKP